MHNYIIIIFVQVK